jgi:hypothetical protein
MGARINAKFKDKNGIKFIYFYFTPLKHELTTVPLENSI